MIQLDGPQSGPSFWGSDRGFRTGVGLGVGLCLGSICLAVCQYSGVSEFVLRGKTAGQILTVDLRSLLSFSLCLMVRSAGMCLACQNLEYIKIFCNMCQIKLSRF